MTNTTDNLDLNLDCDLLSLLHQTDLEAYDGERDCSEERERHAEEPRVAADEPVPRVVVAVMTGMMPLAVFHRLLLLES
jgi:hypothetical protein